MPSFIVLHTFIHMFFQFFSFLKRCSIFDDDDEEQKGCVLNFIFDKLEFDRHVKYFIFGWPGIPEQNSLSIQDAVHCCNGLNKNRMGGRQCSVCGDYRDLKRNCGMMRACTKEYGEEMKWKIERVFLGFGVCSYFLKWLSFFSFLVLRIRFSG